jgi:uncharacterized OB-fold protein
MQIPKPELTDLNRPYWEGLERGHLLIQRCDCGHAWLPARKFCPACLQNSTRWEQSKGTGRLVSWVVYHTAFHEAFADRLPYNVALVELDEGPRLITNMVDRNDLLRPDARVCLQIERDQGLALPRFRLAS